MATMSDGRRYRYLTVGLDHDMTDQEVETICSAIMMIKGVLLTTRGEAIDTRDLLARMDASNKLRAKILSVLDS